MKFNYFFRMKNLIFVLIGLIVFSACASEPTEVAPIKGAIAPDFSLLNLEGETVSLSDFRGKSVIVNFWATWCGPCRLEMPELEAAYQEHQPDLVILAVDIMESPEQVSDFFLELELSFEPLLDTDGSIQTLYQVRGNPSSYFVDEDGVIQAIHVGLLTEDLLDNYLEDINIQ